MLGYLGLEPVVLVDCGTFLGAALLIAPIASPQRPATADDESTTELARSAWAMFWAEWRDGLRLVRADRTIALLFFVLGLMTYGGTMLDPLTVAWVRDVLDAGPQVFSWMLTVHAASGIVGSFFVGRFGTRLTSRHLMGWSSIVAGAVLVVKYNVPIVALALSLSVINGVTSVASTVGVETLVQRTVPDELRGRVFGALGASGALLSLAGAATGGVLAEVVGIVPMLDVAAGLIVLAGFVVLRAFPARTRTRAAPLAVD